MATTLNVRKGPGVENYPVVLRQVHRGDILIVQSKNIDFDDNPWFLIRVLPDGTEEWISGDTGLVKWYNVEDLAYRTAPLP